MSKYLILYNSSVSASQLMTQSSPEQMQAGRDAWIEWRKKAEEQNVKVDFGSPLQISNSITAQGVDEGHSHIGGYSIMEGDREAVLAILKTHPQLQRPGASIDVMEMLPMPGIDS